MAANKGAIGVEFAKRAAGRSSATALFTENPNSKGIRVRAGLGGQNLGTLTGCDSKRATRNVRAGYTTEANY